jgi:hypothetical protein
VTGVVNVSGGVLVLALLTAIGSATVAHAMYRIRHPEWRSIPWWGNHRVARVALVSAVDTRGRETTVGTVRRTTDVVRALESLLLGTVVLSFVVIASATALA